MGTTFLEIYNMAIAELKDPQLKATLAQNPVMFCKVMYNFFVNAISLFTNPLAVSERLSKRDEPIYHSDVFTGDGKTVEFKFSILPDTDKMDDVVYEEFKGTGNMEMVLDRKLSEKRVFPAIDIPKSGTRREDLLLSPEEMQGINIMRKALNGLKPEEAVEKILDMFVHTKNNKEFIDTIQKIKFF